MYIYINISLVDIESYISSQFRIVFIRKKSVIESNVFSFSGAPQHLTISGL